MGPWQFTLCVLACIGLAAMGGLMYGDLTAVRGALLMAVALTLGYFGLASRLTVAGLFLAAAAVLFFLVQDRTHFLLFSGAALLWAVTLLLDCFPHHSRRNTA